MGTRLPLSDTRAVMSPPLSEPSSNFSNSKPRGGTTLPCFVFLDVLWMAPAVAAPATVKCFRVVVSPLGEAESLCCAS